VPAAIPLKISEASVASNLQEVKAKLQGSDRQIAIDFSSVSRIDAHAVRELKEIALFAEEREVTVHIHGANVEVYKVLKLLALTSRFTFSG